MHIVSLCQRDNISDFLKFCEIKSRTKKLVLSWYDLNENNVSNHNNDHKNSFYFIKDYNRYIQVMLFSVCNALVSISVYAYFCLECKGVKCHVAQSCAMTSRHLSHGVP